MPPIEVNGWHLLFYSPVDASRQFVPKSRCISTWLRVVYPPSPYIIQNSRELSVKGASAPPFIGGLPLTGGPGCAIFRRCGGRISSRAAPFPMIGKGRGDWVEHLHQKWRSNMNFTNSPYEKMMKEQPKGRKNTTWSKAPIGTPCKGCPYWREIACVFCFTERLKKR